MPNRATSYFYRFILLLAGPLALCSPISAAKLKPFAQIKALEIRECSGIVQSRLQNDLYWVHNDSNGGSNLYAIRKDGALQATIPTGLPNFDWEDIATDNSGNLYIGDFGNFENTRRNLAIHKIREPLLGKSADSKANLSYRFAYSEQTEFPPGKRVFDCEALFWSENHLYILSKSLGETITRLYRFENLDPDQINYPRQIGDFDIGPRVTGADASPDGRRLAILTTRSVWVFTRLSHSDSFLDGPVKMLPIQAGQCEAICWVSPRELIVTNENRDLFSIPIGTLIDY